MLQITSPLVYMLLYIVDMMPKLNMSIFDKSFFIENAIQFQKCISKWLLTLFVKNYFWSNFKNKLSIITCIENGLGKFRLYTDHLQWVYIFGILPIHSMSISMYISLSKFQSNFLGTYRNIYKIIPSFYNKVFPLQ